MKPKSQRTLCSFWLMISAGEIWVVTEAGFYDTVNCDRLAASGMRFTNAYAACPVCSPTRASILTGKYPQRVGITDYINIAGGNQPDKWKRKTKMLPAPYRDHLALEEVTIAEALKRCGLRDILCGEVAFGRRWTSAAGPRIRD